MAIIDINIKFDFKSIALDLERENKNIKVIDKKFLFDLNYNGTNVSEFKSSWVLLKKKHKLFNDTRKNLARQKTASFFSIKDSKLYLTFSRLIYDDNVRFNYKTISHAMALFPVSNENDLHVFVKNKFT